MGTEEDCTRFMELMLADFSARCERANEKIFKGRITLLPVEETVPEDEFKDPNHFPTENDPSGVFGAPGMMGG